MLGLIALPFLAFFIYALVKIVRRSRCNPNFDKKVVWITGASSGIGEFLAYEFSRLGATLILSARNLQELERVKKACVNPDKVTVYALDMSKFDKI